MDVVKSRKICREVEPSFLSCPVRSLTHATDWKCLFHVVTGSFFMLSATAEHLIYFHTIEDTDTARNIPRAINCWQS